ncbi:MAG: rod shape-determining protein RodA [Bacteroidia bacterium]|nr:MAG: rod shape-determining protein RodA [Bacteroidia bacterium]
MPDRKHSIDFPALILYLTLVICGWLNIYSSSFTDSIDFSIIGTRYGKQMLMIVINLLILASILMFFKSYLVPTFSYPIYFLILLLLIAVLFLGKSTGGSRSWFVLGSFKLQPSELAKLGTALALAKFINDHPKMLAHPKQVITALAIIFLPALLIILQGDAGSALVFSAFFIVLFRKGLPTYWLVLISLFILVGIAYFYLEYSLIFLLLFVLMLLVYQLLTKKTKTTFSGAILFFVILLILFFGLFLPEWNIPLHLTILAAILIFVLIAGIYLLKNRQMQLLILPVLLLVYIGSVFAVDYAFNNVLKPHQRTRINVLFGKEKDIKDVGYNVHQSKIAIGSGGLSGKGYLKGTQTKYDFVPEQDTDFIFCTVGEEWGFFGTSFIVLLFTIFLFRLIRLAERQRSAFSGILGYGLTAVIFFHFAVNVAMTIGLAPVIGIPLPFFSYGGSSLFSFSLFFFLFLKLDSERNTLLL